MKTIGTRSTFWSKGVKGGQGEGMVFGIAKVCAELIGWHAVM